MKKGWEIKKLGDICDFQGGSQPPKSQFIYEPKKGYVRFLQIRDFSNDKNITYIPESKKNRYCNEEDILLGRYGASVGKVLINKAGAYNVAVMKTIPNESILYKRYFYYYLNTEDFQTRLLNTASRSAQDGFSKADIFDFPILVTPLPEQKRIVAILDEAFAAIATAKAHAEQNLRNARALFESHLQGVFEKGKWQAKSISEISENLDSKRIPITKNKRISGDTPYYGASGIVDYVVDYLFNEDLLCVSEDGANLLARTYPIAFSISGKTWVNNHAHVLRFPNIITQKFVEAYINSIRIDEYVSGMAQPKLNQAMLNKIPIPLPSLTEQQTIVRQLDALRAETQKLEAVYRKKLEGLEELKKSILQQAFAGELKT
jgi:type I restriction enzyme, S subunit